MANLNLNLQQYSFQNSFEPMPNGWYPAIISSSEIVETAKKDGFRLVMTYEIIDGPHKGRKVMSGYNIQNPNPKAVEIAMSELKTLAAAVGVFATLQDSAQLHNIPLQIRLNLPKDSEYNEVKGYKTIQGDDPGKQSQAAPQQAVPVPAQGFGNPAPGANQANQPYGPPPTQQPVYEQPQQQAPPAWAQPPQQQQAPQQAPQTFQAPPQQQAPAAAPAWAPQAPAAAAYQPPAPPAWSPNPAPPQAPAWGRS